jgi:hypothetical protein
LPLSLVGSCKAKADTYDLTEAEHSELLENFGLLSYSDSASARALVTSFIPLLKPMLSDSYLQVFTFQESLEVESDN